MIGALEQSIPENPPSELFADFIAQQLDQSQNQRH